MKHQYTTDKEKEAYVKSIKDDEKIIPIRLEYVKKFGEPIFSGSVPNAIDPAYSLIYSFTDSDYILQLDELCEYCLEHNTPITEKMYIDKCYFDEKTKTYKFVDMFETPSYDDFVNQLWALEKE